MDSNKIFTTVTDDLPQPLPNEELYHLLKLVREGSKEAYDKLVEHNIRLVIYEVNSRFKNVKYIGTILESKDVIELQSKQSGSRKQAKRMRKVISKSHKGK